jgi:hypothetical protein
MPIRRDSVLAKADCFPTGGIITSLDRSSPGATHTSSQIGTTLRFQLLQIIICISVRRLAAINKSHASAGEAITQLQRPLKGLVGLDFRWESATI